MFHTSFVEWMNECINDVSAVVLLEYKGSITMWPDKVTLRFDDLCYENSHNSAHQRKVQLRRPIFSILTELMLFACAIID